MGRRAQSQHYFRIDFKHHCFFFLIFKIVFLNGLFVGRVVTPWGMWDVSSPTMDWTHTPCIGSMEPQPLYCQGSTNLKYYYKFHKFVEWQWYKIHNSLVGKTMQIPTLDKYFRNKIACFSIHPKSTSSFTLSNVCNWLSSQPRFRVFIVSNK